MLAKKITEVAALDLRTKMFRVTPKEWKQSLPANGKPI